MPLQDRGSFNYFNLKYNVFKLNLRAALASKILIPVNIKTSTCFEESALYWLYKESPK